jgi:hypothetical protein
VGQDGLQDLVTAMSHRILARELCPHLQVRKELQRKDFTSSYAHLVPPPPPFRQGSPDRLRNVFTVLPASTPRELGDCLGNPHHG